MINQTINGISAWLRCLKSRKGQTLVEYALVLTFISVLCISVLTVLSGQIRNLYLPIINALAAVQASIQ
jgi:Flp pilus assembly pilin Flp